MTATLGRLVAFAGVPARRLVLTAALGVLAAGLVLAGLRSEVHK